VESEPECDGRQSPGAIFFLHILTASTRIPFFLFIPNATVSRRSAGPTGFYKRKAGTVAW